MDSIKTTLSKFTQWCERNTAQNAINGGSETLFQFGLIGIVVVCLVFCFQNYVWTEFAFILTSVILLWVGSQQSKLQSVRMVMQKPIPHIHTMFCCVYGNISEINCSLVISMLMIVSYVESTYQILYPCILCNLMELSAIWKERVEPNIKFLFVLTALNALELYFANTPYLLTIGVAVGGFYCWKERASPVVCSKLGDCLVFVILMRQLLHQCLAGYAYSGYRAYMFESSGALGLVAYSIRSALTHVNWIHALNNASSLYWFQRQLSSSSNRFWSSPMTLFLLFFGGCMLGSLFDTYLAHSFSAQYASKVARNTNSWTCSWSVCRAVGWNRLVSGWYSSYLESYMHAKDRAAVSNEMYGHRVGASGGVSAVIGSYLFCMLHNQYHRDNVQWLNPQIVVANIIRMDFAWHFFLSEYAQTAWSLDNVVKKYASSDYVSHSAHLAGLMMGVLVAMGIHLFTIPRK